MALIYGFEGYKKLQVGYETHVNDTLRTAFAVANSETGGIQPGDLLLTTSAPKVYTRAKAALTGTQKVAGVCLATNVLLDPQFPQTPGELPFKPGVHAAAVLRGTLAVPFTGTAPTEGAAVYYDFTNRAFTTAAGTGNVNIALPGFRFTGVSEGNVAEIYIQYI